MLFFLSFYTNILTNIVFLKEALLCLADYYVSLHLHSCFPGSPLHQLPPTLILLTLLSSKVSILLESLSAKYKQRWVVAHSVNRIEGVPVVMFLMTKIVAWLRPGVSQDILCEELKVEEGRRLK